MNIINAQGLGYTYEMQNESRRALNDVSFTVREGEFAALLGASGSGKTTLARVLTALLPLQDGKLSVAGFDARDERRLRQIRKSCGIVFQNPDAQFAAATVGEDVAFGARCFGTEEEEIPARVKEALAAAGLRGAESRAPQLLPAEEKLRAALAGVLAVKPDIIILDCVMSSLGTEERRAFMKTVKALNANGLTVIMATNSPEEAAEAERVLLLRGGELIADGAPRALLSDGALLESAFLELPFAARLYYDLLSADAATDICPLTIDELVEEVCR